MEEIIGNPIFAALSGWLAFNVFIFSFTKDDYDDTGKDFPIGPYVKTHYDNWLASVLMIPVLLYIGYYKFDIGMINPENPKWSDLYYLGSGFFTELIKIIYKRWKTKNQ